ncbi:MAG: hypothetical protein AVDCRST_MAG39-1550 [uncultured Sphingomonadaceae bacterium]|uniref:Uncharacterized protein n=1 Tax=uncultured Sphingomonadaceae bacterium TaxID=169976 RepID=A0A6J4SSF2_9SPHN|nr:MAG: hypothetical protein AVDCRST_MAG39-1550 [uncultured Sphingomonadaceae bacterium]
MLLLADLLSGYWLFVLANAAVSLGLSRLFLCAFALDRDRSPLVTTALLSLGSTLAFYGSYLLADLYTGQGVLALLLIAIDRRARGGWEWAFPSG